MDLNPICGTVCWWFAYQFRNVIQADRRWWPPADQMPSYINDKCGFFNYYLFVSLFCNHLCGFLYPTIFLCTPFFEWPQSRTCLIGGGLLIFIFCSGFTHNLLCAKYTLKSSLRCWNLLNKTHIAVSHIYNHECQIIPRGWCAAVITITSYANLVPWKL